MANPGAASLAALSPARAAASRRNGARSKGPKSPEGKARAAMNALKHGLCAGTSVVLGDEDQDLFDALEAGIMEELAPQSPMQAALVRRIVFATWRLERMEGELLAHNMRATASFGLGLSRDCNGAGAFNTLLRYRNAALAEFWRSLRTLEALQAKAARAAEAAVEEVEVQEAAAALQKLAAALHEGEAERRIEPKTRGIPDQSAALPGSGPGPAPAPMAAPVETSGPAPARPASAGAARPGALQPRGAPGGSAPVLQPIEPERRTNPGEPVLSMAREMVTSATALMAAAAQPGSCG